MIFLPEDSKKRLENHPIFRGLQTIEQLRAFMELHVYAVWDFMSLLKELQSKIAPQGSPWLPNKNTQIVRLINEIVLEEESDTARPDSKNEYASHFEMYLMAMEEIGASTIKINSFLEAVETSGIENVLENKIAPVPVQKFLESTFEIIRSGKVHEIAASFAYGRENIVPVMFSRILENCQVKPDQAPLFHYYLERHAELDSEQHGPMSDRLVSWLVNEDPVKKQEVLNAAQKSINARIDLWENVNQAITNLINVP